MNMGKAFEIIMLVCFGFSWPVSIVKSYRSRSTKGKSLLFLVLIVIGYLAGIMHKILDQPDFVLYLYAINAAMVSTDILFYFRNRALMKKEDIA